MLISNLGILFPVQCPSMDCTVLLVVAVISLSCYVLHVVDTVAGAVRKLCKETNSVVVSVE